jgi:hypothetical protein
MRRCGLRAVLAASPEADQWVLHAPRAWLGIAFHAVTRAARSSMEIGDTQRVWDHSIAQAVTAASLHRLDRRFASPERWPSYYLVRQRSLGLALQSTRPRGGELPRHRNPAGDTSARGTERLYEARGGRLVGRPDYFDGQTITEYKSSLPNAAWPGASALLESYRRQLRLYAAIIFEATAIRPGGARIVAATGEILQVPVEPAECEAEADSAVAALEKLNQDLISSGPVDSIAIPTAENCAGCPFQMICPSFWNRLKECGTEDMPDTAFEGVLESLEEGPDGDLYTSHVRVLAASRPIEPLQPVVLRASVHGRLGVSALGYPCRFVDFFVRPDGRVRAELATLAMATADLPALQKAISAQLDSTPLEEGHPKCN